MCRGELRRPWGKAYMWPRGTSYSCSLARNQTSGYTGLSGWGKEISSVAGRLEEQFWWARLVCSY